ncbi:hypothetical protein EYZ11_001419 [Aspergillus tanneri]|uniref:Uncharacterized protein n=1 Tax=Aspergillus tanneri TaxID=1220188 RepID=A0A4S3JUM7_9EURO|nr:uncharacterized protein ATNIH1004_010235 [Aspergillus tanneri]KAA8643466.1 hypothetical protein ATNIH1004_010235 [Aspergillus tanneri]THC99098.1 hypothetical protein EYZ11_001419 [Aspergillus tanneri]
MEATHYSSRSYVLGFVSCLPDTEYTAAEDLARPSSDSVQNPGRQRYTSSKLANVLWTYALHRRQRIVTGTGRSWTVVASCPRFMPGTGLARETNSMEQFIWHRVLPKMLPVVRVVTGALNVHTPEESGASLAWLTIAPEVVTQWGVF